MYSLLIVCFVALTIFGYLHFISHYYATFSNPVPLQADLIEFNILLCNITLHSVTLKHIHTTLDYRLTTARFQPLLKAVNSTSTQMTSHIQSHNNGQYKS